MSRGLPPNPKQFRDLQRWAEQFYEYQISQQRFTDRNNPLPVLLPHRTGGIMERAATDGIMLYDPEQNTPVFSLGGNWEPVGMDSDILLAQQVVFDTYGDTVSVYDKKKFLSKFGQNLTVGTSFETVAEFQGTVANETYVSTNIIDSISSSNQLNDVGLTFVLEGHTIDGSGNLTFVVQDATLDATDARTKVALTTPLARATRLYLKDSGTFDSPQAVPTGAIYVYDDTGGITNGVPNTAAATKLLITAGETQSEKCATSISSQDYWFITQFSAAVGVSGGNANRIEVRMERRDVANGGEWRPLGREIILGVNNNGVAVTVRPFIIVPKNHDWRIRARTDTNSAAVYAEANGYLALVQ